MARNTVSRIGSAFLIVITACSLTPVMAQQQSEAPLKTIPIKQSKPKDKPSGPVFGFVVGGGGEIGGGKVATVAFTDGSTQNIRAGQGLIGYAGGTFRPDRRSPWSARATVGYKYVTTKASNATIDLGRVPLEFIGSYEFDNGARFGTGLVYHTAIKLNGDGFFEDVKFKDAVGFRVEAGWKWLLLSYTNLKYKAKDVDGSADASSFGFHLAFAF